MEKSRLIAAFIAMFLILVSLFIITDSVKADQTQPDQQGVYIQLTEGKNYISFLQASYVKEFMRKNPDIEAISFYDPALDKTTGYVRALGGIGKNFILVPGQEYEVIASKDTTVRVD